MSTSDKNYRDPFEIQITHTYKEITKTHLRFKLYRSTRYTITNITNVILEQIQHLGVSILNAFEALQSKRNEFNVIEWNQKLEENKILNLLRPFRMPKLKIHSFGASW